MDPNIYHLKATLVLHTILFVYFTTAVAVGMWLCYHFDSVDAGNAITNATAAAVAAVNVFTKEKEWRENEIREIKRQNKRHTPYTTRQW